MGCTYHLHPLWYHRLLGTHLHLPQSLYHPHRDYPTHEAWYVREQKGKFYGKTSMPYHGDDGSNLRIHPGYRKNGGYPELRDYGKPAAGRIFLAGWRHPGIYPATCRQR